MDLSTNSGFTAEESALMAIREAELEVVRGYLSEGRRVLDYGGGNGYLARLLANAGCHVESVDVAVSQTGSHWPVKLYDGRTLPFPTEFFDVVFSSCTLEHLPDHTSCLREMARVLTADGIMLHVVPSPWWRFWSNFTHYVWVWRQVIQRISQHRPAAKRHDTGSSGRRPNPWRAFVAARHGEHARNAITEVFHYSRFMWQRMFKRASLHVLECRPSRIFYAEHLLFPHITIETRRLLSRFMGSCSYIFVLRRDHPP